MSVKKLLGLIFVGVMMVISPNYVLAKPSEQILSDQQITEELKSLPGWRVDNQELVRTYEFKNFVEAIKFVKKLVEPAEKAGHHPDIAISYNKVTVRLSTHDLGGITQKDFELAQTISKLE